jgi:hypothetical protein
VSPFEPVTPGDRAALEAACEDIIAICSRYDVDEELLEDIREYFEGIGGE